MESLKNLIEQLKIIEENGSETEKALIGNRIWTIVLSLI